MAAAVEFRRGEVDLMDRLSKRLCIVRLEAFYKLEIRPLLSRGWFRDKVDGELDSRWKYGFTGVSAAPETR